MYIIHRIINEAILLLLFDFQVLINIKFIIVNNKLYIITKISNNRDFCLFFV